MVMARQTFERGTEELEAPGVAHLHPHWRSVLLIWSARPANMAKIYINIISLFLENLR